MVMVCRENKARSAIMAFQKYVTRMVNDGRAVLHDNEYQSAIHDAQHRYAGVADLSVEQQQKYLRVMRQQISQVPGIPDNVLYRESRNQPGIITRINQELDRLEHPEKLRPEQLNRGDHWAAIMRLGDMVQKITPAKQQYLETWARHTGNTMQAAEQQWNHLMGRTGDFSQIHLTDEYRQALSVGGLTSQSQVQLSQSGKSRDTLMRMEQLRSEALAGTPTRTTPFPEEHTYVSPDGLMKCSQCGQFGHEQATCPNSAATAEIDRLRAQQDAAYSVVQQQRLTAYRDDLMASGHPDAEVAADAVAKVQQTTGRESVGNAEAIDAQRLHAQLGRQIADRHAELVAAGPRVSSAAAKIRYNRDSGTLIVTAQPYTRRDGMTLQPSYMYRVSPEVYDELNRTDSLGKVLTDTVWRRGKDKTPNDGFKFENDSDQAAALRQHRCPTCGKWASMNSQHQCVINGTAPPRRSDDDVEVTNRGAYAAYRQHLRNAYQQNLSLPTPPMDQEWVYPNGMQRQLGPGMTGSLPNPLTVQATITNGRVARVPVTVTAPDGAVSGYLRAWQDPSGQQLLSALPIGGKGGLSCTCRTYADTGSCAHVMRVRQVCARQWQCATVSTNRLTPGVSIREFKSPQSIDAPEGELDRMSVERHLNLEREAISQRVRQYNQRIRSGAPIPAAATPPLDSETGKPLGWPSTWNRTATVVADDEPVKSKPVDLGDPQDVMARIRQGLFSRSRIAWSVTNNEGALWVDVPPALRVDGARPQAEIDRLAGLLGLSPQAFQYPPGSVGPKGPQRMTGFMVPADTSWRHQALDRAYGDRGRLVPAGAAE